MRGTVSAKTMESVYSKTRRQCIYLHQWSQCHSWDPEGHYCPRHPTEFREKGWKKDAHRIYGMFP